MKVISHLTRHYFDCQQKILREWSSSKLRHIFTLRSIVVVSCLGKWHTLGRCSNGLSEYSLWKFVPKLFFFIKKKTWLSNHWGISIIFNCYDIYIHPSCKTIIVRILILILSRILIWSSPGYNTRFFWALRAFRYNRFNQHNTSICTTSPIFYLVLQRCFKKRKLFGNIANKNLNLQLFSSNQIILKYWAFDIRPNFNIYWYSKYIESSL